MILIQMQEEENTRLRQAAADRALLMQQKINTQIPASQNATVYVNTFLAKREAVFLLSYCTLLLLYLFLASK